jgi:DNA-binding response OmpR family regulator
MLSRIALPVEGATKEELWEWIEKNTILLEALNQETDKVIQIAYDLSLTKMEAEIFRFMYRRRNIVVSESMITDYLYGLSSNKIPVSRAVAVNICSLRKKLKDAGYDITTVRGVGWALKIPKGKSTS